MKKIYILFLLALVGFGAKAQNLAVKTNAVDWAICATPNAAVEVALCNKMTLSVDGLYNPWKWKDQKSSKAWAVQPELRYWLCSKFAGHFFGVHGTYGKYDCGMDKYNYDGHLWNAGVSYGYVLPLHERWRLEFNLGAGWNQLSYDKTDRISYPGDVVMYDPEKKNRFGLTRAGISISFLIF